MRISKKFGRYFFLALLVVLTSAIVSADTSTTSFPSSSFNGVSYGTNFVNPSGYQTSYQTYYTQQDLNSYWPILDNETFCQSRQDLILQVTPGGCQPAVVRSDLLADQNVPVFCQIDALKLNPLIDISQINSIRFTQQYPEGVAGIGFHPANAALRTSDTLLGSPILNNIGYVVVILKQNQNESSLPSLISVNLTGAVSYDAGNALGIGSADFVLSPTSDLAWSNPSNRDSFWQGRYYLRLERADPTSADVSIYQGDNKISTTRVQAGKNSDKIYLPGFYCQASLQVEYDGFTTAQNKARLEIDGDTVDVYQGSSVLNGKCSVSGINIDSFKVGDIVLYLGNTRANVTGINYDGTYTITTTTSGNDFKTPKTGVKFSDLTRLSGDTSGSVTISCGYSNSVTLSRKPAATSSGSTSSMGSSSTSTPSNTQSINMGDIYVNKTGGKLKVVSVTAGQYVNFDDGEMYLFANLPAYGITLLSSSGTSGVSQTFNIGDTVYYQGQKAEICSVDQANGKYSIAEFDQIFNGDISPCASGTNDITVLASDLTNAQGVSLSGQKPQDKTSSPDIDAAVSDAIKSYENIADLYPYEKSKDLTIVPTYGELALGYAIDLADKYSKFATEANLINKFIQLYPSSSSANTYKIRLQSLYVTDSSSSNTVVYLDNKYRSIKLIGLTSPTKKAGAYFTISNNPNSQFIAQGSSFNLFATGSTTGANAIRAGTITLNSLSADTALVNTYCVQQGLNGQIQQSGGNPVPYIFRLGQGGQTSQTVCGQTMTLNSIDMEELARVRLIPSAENTESQVNLTVGVGIEKRAIQLSPDKTKEMIDNINKSIAKWEGINNNLGKVVSGMKAACFATSAALTIKSFISGVNGAGIARQSVMTGDNGWNIRCQQMVAQGQYKNVNTCFSANSNSIDADVQIRAAAINKVNTDLSNIPDCKSQSTNILGSLFGSSSTVDRTKCATAYYNYVNTTYGAQKITLSDGSTKSVSDMLALRPGEGYQNGTYTLDQLKNIELNIQSMQAPGVSNSLANNSLSGLQTVYKQIGDNKQLYDQVLNSQKLSKFGLPDDANTIVGGQGQSTIYKAIVPSSTVNVPNLNLKSTSATKFVVPAGIIVGSGGSQGGRGGYTIPAGTYVAGLTKSTASTNSYGITELHYVNGLDTNNPSVSDTAPDGTQVNTTAFINQFMSAIHAKDIAPSDQINYNNYYLNPQVKYYETDPYKGMPAIVPFDTQRGWYAATKQTLPAFGAQGAFDSSGRVSSFWLCNVGPNHIEQFEEGFGDDQCELINLNTGQPINQFPNLDPAQAQTLVKRAIQALNDAANQYGSGQGPVKITGVDSALQRGSPAVNLPATQCTDFMSPTDCNYLFNVCDPVICPSSRCNLGGAYNVPDVIQTGIIGSLVMCLPNFGNPTNGGVAIPICLTGLNAGLDNYISVLKASRDCLSQSLSTGNLVGICDEITSVYTCEFFWRQIAPFANLLLPKLIELAYTGGQARGGGEYMTVMGAWQNTQNAVNYFTNVYAVNSLNAFKIRSVEEAGTTFCQAFISAKAPNSLKTLIQPDSPPQFSAWFSSIPYTTATVPATSQYKVYYHIFGGNDAGVYYNVYLKNGPTSGYYYISPMLTVASGFITKGQYADQTRDFTAPTGYKELCVSVNGQEQCGFNQVSTSFAVNYLSDSYAQNQINQTGINSQQTCISGSGSLGALVTSPNIQAGAEAAALPQIYNNGITRICATQNPGSTTDPTRYVNVGNCGDPKITCWLDKNSANNAISQADTGIRNATLSDLQAIQQQAILNNTGFTSDQLSSALDTINSEVNTLANSVNGNTNLATIQASVTAELTKIDNTFGVNLENLVLNTQKAQVLYLKARLKGILAQSYYNNNPPAKQNAVNTNNQNNAANGGANTNSNTGGGNTNTGSTNGNTPTLTSTVWQLPNTGGANVIYFTFTNNQWQWSFDLGETWVTSDQTVYNYPQSQYDGDSPSIGNLQIIASLQGKSKDAGDQFLANQHATIYSSGSTPAASNGNIAPNTPNTGTGSVTSGVPILTNAVLDAPQYDPTKAITISIVGQSQTTKTGVYLQNNKVYLTKSLFGADSLYPDKQIGIVDSNQLITLLPSATNDIGADNFYMINGSTIQKDQSITGKLSLLKY